MKIVLPPGLLDYVNLLDFSVNGVDFIEVDVKQPVNRKQVKYWRSLIDWSGCKSPKIVHAMSRKRERAARKR